MKLFIIQLKNTQIAIVSTEDSIQLIIMNCQEFFENITHQTGFERGFQSSYMDKSTSV